MASEWLSPEERAERRGDVAIENYQVAQEEKAVEAAVYADQKFYHYPDGWFGMEPS